jgi:hypothetical protein
MTPWHSVGQSHSGVRGGGNGRGGGDLTVVRNAHEEVCERRAVVRRAGGGAAAEDAEHEGPPHLQVGQLVGLGGRTQDGLVQGVCTALCASSLRAGGAHLRPGGLAGPERGRGPTARR